MELIRILPFLISIFFCTFSYTQNAYHRETIDKEDGALEEHYIFGRISSRFELINGKIHGERQTFYRSGKVLNIESYDNGLLNGTTINFNRRGDTTSIEEYKHDTLIFLKEYYYRSNHKLKLISETSFVQDSTLKINPFNMSNKVRHRAKLSHQDVIESTTNQNVTSRFYRNGKAKSISGFYNDDNHGLQISYYRNGNVRIESNYNENELNGLFKEYYKSGIIRFECNYLNNELNGSNLEYDKEGKLVTNEIYKNGELVEQNNLK